jgi:hypothetical protein
VVSERNLSFPRFGVGVPQHLQSSSIRPPETPALVFKVRQISRNVMPKYSEITLEQVKALIAQYNVGEVISFEVCNHLEKFRIYPSCERDISRS